MRRAVVLSLLLCACGITARGTMTGDGGSEPQADASTADAGEADAVAAMDATVEAEVDAGPCDVTVEDTFSAAGFDPLRWFPTANAANAQRGYPKPQVAGSTFTAKFMDDTTDQVSAGLWHTQVVPFEAFDISFDIYAVCGGNCGDGLAVAWLAEATSTQLADAAQGSALGIPKSLAGAAVALDLADNADRGELEGPAMTVLDIDGSDPTTPYDWVVGTSETNNMLVNQGAKRIDITMRAKVVTVRVDGVEKTKGTVTHLPMKGMFGFTAASGAFNATVAIGDVKAKFYRCNAP
jgi:hypothetical protein